MRSLIRKYRRQILRSGLVMMVVTMVIDDEFKL